MKKLLNTLYITSENKYLGLDGECVVIKESKKEISRMPLHNLDSIVTFSYTGASPALIGKCAEYCIPIVFMTSYGKFLGRTSGKINGNVVLRKAQYKLADERNLPIARNIILGKVYNGRWVIGRYLRDHKMQVNQDKLKSVSDYMQSNLSSIRSCDNIDSLRGIEGKMAEEYFSVFDDMILHQKEDFQFAIRSRRPPMDKVNALLSFSYSLLTNMVTSALESVGLDPCVGFMHSIRPGRYSLALDMMEELRPAFADRFVLKLINKKMLSASDFITKEDGAVLLTYEGRKIFLSEWQARKKEELIHPYLSEKIEWGIVPYVQAMLLARHIRGDIDEYPPFLWK